jgi:hypothetical protein
MIRRGMSDIIERFAHDRDRMLLANFELFGCFETEGKPCIVQPKTVCRSSHHFRPTGISALMVPTLLRVASSSAIKNVVYFQMQIS